MGSLVVPRKLAEPERLWPRNNPFQKENAYPRSHRASIPLLSTTLVSIIRSQNGSLRISSGYLHIASQIPRTAAGAKLLITLCQSVVSRVPVVAVSFLFSYLVQSTLYTIREYGFLLRDMPPWIIRGKLSSDLALAVPCPTRWQRKAYARHIVVIDLTV